METILNVLGPIALFILVGGFVWLFIGRYVEKRFSDWRYVRNLPRDDPAPPRPLSSVGVLDALTLSGNPILSGVVLTGWTRPYESARVEAHLFSKTAGVAPQKVVVSDVELRMTCGISLDYLLSVPSLKDLPHDTAISVARLMQAKVEGAARDMLVDSKESPLS